MNDKLMKFMSFMKKYADTVKLVMGLTDIAFNIEVDQSVGVACTRLEPGKRANIYINPYHSMFNTPNEQVNVRNLLGVLVHEMLHKLYTDPTYEKVAVGRSDANGKPITHPNLFHTVNNILEDFVIESRCILTLDVPTDVIRLLKRTMRMDLEKLNPVDNLDSAILTSWKMSPPIQETDKELDQIIDAMIMFTDMGPLVPGSSLKEELKSDISDIYTELLASVFEAPNERIKRAINIYTIVDKYCPNDIAQPQGTCTGKNGDAQKELSQDEIDKMSSSPRMKGQKELLKKILKTLKKSASESTDKDSKGENAQQSQKPSSSDSDKKEESSEKKDDNASNKTGASSGKESKDDMPKQSSKGNEEEKPEENDSDGKDGDDQDSDPVSKENASEGDNKESENTDSGKTPEKNDSDGKDTGDQDESTGSKENASEGDNKESESADSDKTPEDTKSGNSEPGEFSEEDLPEETGDPTEGLEDDEYDENGSDPFLGDSNLIASTIKDAEEIVSKEKITVEEIEEAVQGDFESSQKKDSETVKITKDSNNAYAEKIECRNYTVDGVSASTEKAYRQIIEENRTFVSRFARKLSELAKEDELREPAKSGHLNLTRYAKKNQISLRVFEKRTRKERTDSRVIICLDCSGSMSGNKINKAKTALACIVEGLAKADIPVKVMTFCEQPGYVEHHHYVNYKSSMAAKSSIMMIHADGCNFDGYSIRYALKDLLKGRTKNTLMVVISDGQPNSQLVRNSREDAAMAVREAKRRTKVIGIGVDANQDVLRTFYKDTFVELRSIETLMSTLSKLIVKEVKSWA